MVKGRARSEHLARSPPVYLLPPGCRPSPQLLSRPAPPSAAGPNAMSSCYSWAPSLPEPAEGGEGNGRVSSYCWLNKAKTHSRKETLSQPDWCVLPSRHILKRAQYINAYIWNLERR